MISLGEVSELVGDLSSGELLWRDAYPALLCLLVEHSVDEVLGLLPERFQATFVMELRASFENEVPVETLLWFEEGAPDSVSRARIVARAREWLRREPTDR